MFGAGPATTTLSAGIVVNPKVFSTPVRADGTLGEFGGLRSSAAPSHDIWFSHLDNGPPGPWQSVRSDLESEMFHLAAVDSSSGDRTEKRTQSSRVCAAGATPGRAW